MEIYLKVATDTANDMANKRTNAASPKYSRLMNLFIDSIRFMGCFLIHFLKTRGDRKLHFVQERWIYANLYFHLALEYAKTFLFDVTQCLKR